MYHASIILFLLIWKPFTWNLWPIFVPHKLRIICKGYRFEFVDNLFKWIGRYVGHIFESYILMSEIHLVEMFPYLLMWYTSRFVCKAMSIHMHVT